MKIIPTEKRILVRMHNLQKKTSVLLPDGSSLDTPYGEVLATGPEVTNISLGEFVIFLPNAMLLGLHVEDGEEVFLINEGSILAKLDDRAKERIPA